MSNYFEKEFGFHNEINRADAEELYQAIKKRLILELEAHEKEVRYGNAIRLGKTFNLREKEGKQ